MAEPTGCLPAVRESDSCKTMDSPTPELLTRTVQPRYANGERKLARSAFMQTTWGLLTLAAIAQLLLLVWLDIL